MASDSTMDDTVEQDCNTLFAEDRLDWQGSLDERVSVGTSSAADYKSRPVVPEAARCTSPLRY